MILTLLLLIRSKVFLCFGFGFEHGIRTKIQFQTFTTHTHENKLLMNDSGGQQRISQCWMILVRFFFTRVCFWSQIKTTTTLLANFFLLDIFFSTHTSAFRQNKKMNVVVVVDIDDDVDDRRLRAREINGKRQ